MKEEHSFLEYEKLVYKYKELVSELQYSVEKVYNIHAHAYSSPALHPRHSLCQHTQLHVYTCMCVYIQMLLCVLHLILTSPSLYMHIHFKSKALIEVSVYMYSVQYL